MKLIQTLVVRDEVDIVGTQIAYHLNAGIDFVLATDHDSVDGTTEVLEALERDGHLRLIREQGEMREQRWRTRMARLAATEYGADWVINTDADEFWMPRGGTLKEVLGAVPEPFGVVWALSRHFVPRPDDGAHFADRMTLRVSPAAPLNDPRSPFRPHLKAAHRADPRVHVGFGSHLVRTDRWASLHHWHPADVLHFPFRSLEQWERKGTRRARGDKPLGQYVSALLASESGRAADRYRSLVVDDDEAERGRAAGSLVLDERLRSALRALGGAPVPLARDPDAIQDAAGARDADLVRLQRHYDGLEARVRALDSRAGG
jgi:hypothetical protein